MKTRLLPMFLIGSAVALFSGCAASSKTCKQCPAAPPKTAAPPAKAAAEAVAPRLTDLVPASARAMVVVRRGIVTSLTEPMLGDPQTRADLSGYLRRVKGVDLTELEGLVAFMTSLDPPSGAMLLCLSGPASPTGEPAGQHRGVALVRLDRWGKLPMVGAAHPLGLVFGDAQAVKQAIDVTRGAPHAAAGEGSTLASVLTADGDAVGLIGGVTAAGLPPQVAAMAGRFGIRSAALTYDNTRTIRLRVDGDPRGLAVVRDYLMAAARQQLGTLEQAKRKAMAGQDVGAATAAISGYHLARRLLEQVEPRITEQRLVSSFQLPSSSSTQLTVAVAGILAAVAVPAFVKFVRKSKAKEATVALEQIAAGARAYYKRRRRFPPGAGWTPARPCCESASASTCQVVKGDWLRPPWRELGFAPADAHYFQYRFTSSGRGKKARFWAEARGDLDCDGKSSSFGIAGTVGPGGKVMVKGPKTEDETE